MKNFYTLVKAIEYIEDNLHEDVSQNDIASVCHVSLSGLQKMFRYTFNYSIKEYLTKRRLTNAAKELVHSNQSITEIAMKYQYHSIETFIRAFQRLWGKNPSEFRRQEHFTEIFPKIEMRQNKETNQFYFYQDVTELYDKLLLYKDRYVICFDLVDLISINKISREAGDRAIMEVVRRIVLHMDQTMCLFRIGGDEFALLTEYKTSKEAENLVQQVLSYNGKGITYHFDQIPVYTRVWFGKYQSDQDILEMTETLRSYVKNATSAESEDCS